MIVHLLSGQDISVPVDDQEKVISVKKKILTSLNKLQESVSLLNQGVILDDDCTLNNYRIVFCTILNQRNHEQ